MREIKFRAWDTVNEVFAEIDELDGDFDFIKDGDRVRSTASWQDVLTGQLAEIIPSQYTGLKDKKGKEIYEGDICLASSGVNGSIVFFNGRFCWTDGCCHWDIVANVNGCINENYIAKCKGLEIIGNTYENPELLE